MQKAVIEYWQACRQQEALNSITPAQIKNIAHKISANECQQGRIAQPQLLQQLLARDHNIVIVPYYAQRGESYFFPLLLCVELQVTGEFKTQYATAVPIFPKTVLEPAPLRPVSLGAIENLYNYTIINPPAWQEDTLQLGWGSQLGYAQQVLQAVCGERWLQDLHHLGYMMQEGALCFALNDLCAPVNMEQKIIGKKTKITLLDAPRNSGKSEHVKQKIIEAWIEAGVRHSVPPPYVWLQPNQDIKYCSIFDCIDLVVDENDNGDLATSLQSAHQQLSQRSQAYSRGTQLVKNWQSLNEQLQEKYADKGGIEARIAQLRANFKEAKAHNRHVQVLFSIWLRQLDLIENWSSFMDFIPSWQSRRLQRLYQFFKQNFAGQEVKGLKLKQMHEIMQDKKRRAENTERFVGDALHQVENDVLQENIVREKCLQWGVEQNLIATDLLGITQQIPQHIWNQVLIAAKRYWRLAFRYNDGYADFLHRTPDKIDLLIVEHAEYISPMLGAELLAKSQRALILGNYNPLCVPRFSTQIDYELARHFGLADCDEEFEDLQFDGVAGSVGNLWNLAAKDREADEFLNISAEHSLNYEAIDVPSTSEPYLGSMINSAEVVALLAWLEKNPHLMDDLAIYTSFSGQAQQIAEALLDARIANIPVLMIQEPSFNKYSTVIFLPVYAAQDAGPYCFDRGTEMLDNMRANTKQRLVVIGDMRIFKPQLHSASGKFAKLFLNHITSTNITTTPEVHCV